jgi:ankyrin repeat protein
MTPVEVAEQEGHKEIIDILVQYGAPLISEKEVAQLRFIRFAREHDIIGMEKAIRNGADVDGTDNRGKRALTEAVRWVTPNSELKWYASVVYLLQKGANPNTQGKDGKPLHNAMFSSHLLFKRYTNGDDIYGFLTIEALLKAGAHVSSSDQNGCTPLHIAAKWNNVQGAYILLKAGAKIMDRDKESKTPLDYAESAEMIKLLKSHGAKEE